MPDGKNGYILVVEDDKGVCELEAQRLEPLGLEVRKAHTAGEAMAVLAAGLPELMLVDYSLEDANALDLVEKIRNSGAVPPFIVVTGRGDEDVAVAVMKAGASDYIIKNADFLDDLLAGVKKALDKESLTGELRSARAELDRTSAQLTRIMQVTPVIFFTLKAAAPGEMAVNWLSENAPALTGYSFTEMMAYGWWLKNLHPYDKERVLAEQRVLPVKKFLTQDFRLRKKDGTFFWVHSQMNLSAENEGEITGSWTDITQLKESEERFQELFEKAPVGYQSMDAQGRLMAVNDTSCRIFGRNREEVLGHCLAEYLTPESKAHFPQCFERIKAGGRVDNVEMELERPDGTHRWLIFSGKVVLNRDGSFRQTHCVFDDITELREQRKQMRRLSNAISASFNEIYIYGPDDFRFIFVNSAVFNNLGYSMKEIQRLRPWDVKTGLDEPSFRELVRPLLDKEQSQLLFETSQKRKDGSIYPVEVRLQLVGSGEEKFFLAVVNDITERKKAEEQILHNEARLESLERINAYQPKDLNDLLEFALSEAIALTGSKQGYIYHYSEEEHGFILNTQKDGVNVCRTLNAQSRAELEKTDIWRDIVNRRQPAMINDFQALNPLANGYPQAYVHLKKLMLIPVIMGGRLAAAVGVADRASDYTEANLRQLTLLMDSVWKIVERDAAREKIAAGEKSFKALLDSSPDGIIVRRGREVLYINGTGLGIIKARSDIEVIGKDIIGLLPPEHSAQLLERIKQVDETGIKTQPMEITYKALDGSAIDLEFSGTPIRFHGEKCAVVYFRNISERKRGERLMHEIANMQRVESLGALAGGIAHDFNNMLTGIMANVSLLSARVTGKDSADIIQDIIGAARNAQLLTAQLLSFSKGGKPVKHEFSLEKALTDIFHLSTRGVKAACKMDVPGELWSVAGDENQIKQAINNLLVNSLQAMPSGGKLILAARNITFSAGHGPLPKGSYVVITVADTGIGISEDLLPRIFEPYFTTKAQGHGLGLSMTWSVAKNHGGLVEVSSVPGKGAEFRMYLPASGHAMDSAGENGKQVLKGTGRILLLEDDEIIGRAAERMLAELGYTCALSVEGEAALKLYEDEKKAGRPFDAAIMDLTIPGGMGGKEAGALLRKADPGAVIVVSSGYSEEPVMADYETFGFNAVLPKPYRYEDLSEVLARLLKK